MPCFKKPNIICLSSTMSEEWHIIKMCTIACIASRHQTSYALQAQSSS
jgi:hypothetical protein